MKGNTSIGKVRVLAEIRTGILVNRSQNCYQLSQQELTVNMFSVESWNQPGHLIAWYHALKGVIIEFRTRKFCAAFEQSARSDWTQRTRVHIRFISETTGRIRMKIDIGKGIKICRENLSFVFVESFQLLLYLNVNWIISILLKTFHPTNSLYMI
jgi:hypothetical protein